MIYYWYLYYKRLYGDYVASVWLNDIIDFWYTEDLEVIKKYNGLNQFKLWNQDYGCSTSKSAKDC